MAAEISRSSFEPADPLQPLLLSASGSSSVDQRIAQLYADSNSFWHCMSYQATEELSGSCLVSKSWCSFISGSKGQRLWEALSIIEGVPLVEGAGRDRRGDFSLLRPLTISGKVFRRYLGEIVGEVPLMRRDCFVRLRDSRDDFEPEKWERDTHVVIVDPAALKIRVSPDRPLALNESGTLVAVSAEKQAEIVPEELIVSCLFENVMMLANCPLEGSENGPVFGADALRNVQVCNTSPSQNGILIMRKEIVARNAYFNGDQGQNEQVRKLGWKIATVRERGLLNAINVLNTGSCLDSQSVGSFQELDSNVGGRARSAERFYSAGSVFRMCIGGFFSRGGIRLFMQPDYPDKKAGVAPVDHAEVLRPLEHEQQLDEEH